MGSLLLLLLLLFLLLLLLLSLLLFLLLLSGKQLFNYAIDGRKAIESQTLENYLISVAVKQNCDARLLIKFVSQ